jgi:hypothetical protein
MKRITDCNDRITRVDCCSTNSRGFGKCFGDLQQRKIVQLVSGDDSEADRTLSSEIAMDIPNAPVDYMIVCDNVPNGADTKPVPV